MKKWQKILCGGLAAVVLAGGGAAWHFRNEIQALRYALSYSDEEKVRLQEENEAALSEILEKMNLSSELFRQHGITAGELSQVQELLEKVDLPEGTAEQITEAVQNQFLSGDMVEQVQELLTDSSLTPEAVVQQLEEKLNEAASQVTITPSPAGEPAAGNDNTYDAELSAMVGEIYALRGSFEGQANSLVQQAKNEYYALSAEERKAQRGALASKYLGIAAGLEASCDAQMEGILSRISAYLQQTGGDTSLVGQIRSVYQNEKALKKSQYMSLVK